MMTDPISDMLTRIRNASLVRKGIVEVPASKMKRGIAAILQKEGYLQSVETFGDEKKPMLRLTLKFTEREAAVTGITRVSKPGRRVYRKADELKTVRSGFGIAILSTPNGLMTNVEARKRRLGGEVICEVY